MGPRHQLKGGNIGFIGQLPTGVLKKGMGSESVQITDTRTPSVKAFFRSSSHFVPVGYHHTPQWETGYTFKVSSSNVSIVLYGRQDLFNTNVEIKTKRATRNILNVILRFNETREELQCNDPPKTG